MYVYIYVYVYAYICLVDASSCPAAEIIPNPKLCLGLYKIFFYVEAFVYESIIRALPPQPATRTLL